MHDTLTTAEAAVLTNLADTHHHWWWSLAQLMLTTKLERRAVAYALHELVRKDLAAHTRPLGAEQTWAITTLGEAALADARRLRLAS